MRVHLPLQTIPVIDAALFTFGLKINNIRNSLRNQIYIEMMFLEKAGKSLDYGEGQAAVWLKRKVKLMILRGVVAGHVTSPPIVMVSNVDICQISYGGLQKLLCQSGGSSSIQ